MSINALAAAGDVLITVFLCFTLQISRTGFQKSDTLITKLILFSINTGFLTSLCALASLVCISVWPHMWIYIAFYFCIGRLYCNTLLATLNARKGLRGGSRNGDMLLSFKGQDAQQKTNYTTLGTSSRVGFCFLRNTGTRASLPHQYTAPNNISIKIDTPQEYIRDRYSASSGTTGGVKNPEAVWARL
ncbi:hypothetical protein J3R83DRAFT_12832 [Lanmaoa asiatica]|nr:hypothetical protein J3R83DRAFT_12832 [Lanmaoa asiatica]